MHNIQISDGGTYICEAIGYPPSTPGAKVSVILQVEPFPQQPVTRPPEACALDEATCSNGDCIKKQEVCNGRYDCTDGSDEQRCNPLGCEPNQFTCDNRKCVQKTWMCDSDNDCGDWSDERSCGTTSPGSRCKYNEFECAKANQCIPKSFHCDMEVDCQDQSDEIGCSAVTQDLSVPLPPLVAVDQGGTFTAHCRMIGVPTPVVVWRKNWGHIPAKCVTTSENGYGSITCPDVQDSDQGAYSCEGLNSRGSTFANPDVFLMMNKPNTTSSTCPAGQFNNLAARPEECISCFCFGATSDCSSANLFIYQFPPPVDHHELLDVYFHPDGSVNINDHSSVQSSVRSNRQRNGFQILSFPTETPNYYENYYPFYVMPDNDEQGSYLKSYGGYLTYSVLFNGKGQPVDHVPDVIMKGNGYILVHRGQPLSPGREHKQRIRLFRGEWYKVKDPKTGPGTYVPQGGVLATREDIMMTLVNVENILIKAQYLSGPGIETTISNINMDSAGLSNVGLGQAAFVEECRCPIGYSGLSCEQCAPGFMRHSSGPWLGHCKSVQESCRPGTYGDPSRNIPCEPCPCPLTNPSNQFGRTCYLDTDGQPTCNCEPGYQGRRCEQCARGYSGNPFVPGDHCKREFCDPAGSLSQSPDQYGQCTCKDFTTGPQCNHCKPNTFHLSSIHKKGCISCFCMGITQECTSLKWYRNQITSAFSTSTQDFKLAESSEPTKEITEGLYVDQQNGELVYRDFTKPDVYYWVLPARFLGDRISSYGGYLNYTIRYVPTPGGQSSRNNAPDVELISANHFRLRYYNNDNPVEPNRPVTISVPIIEHKWQREDGKTAERENFLMALADLNAILIKATYTTNTQSASLITVSLDTADERNTNQPRTSEVELCTCPPGYKGFSCEDCDTGYTRTDNGLYLGICEECKCNGHSSQCDPDNGKCYNCRDHTEGDFCDRCQPGYRGNPQRGEPCVRDDDSYQCTCDERGSLSRECRGNECVDCKRNVEGPRCERCRKGTFDLSADHPEGCLECFCSSVSDDCQSANLYITQIPMLIIDNNHGFTLTDSNREDIISDGFKLIPQKNEIGFNLQNQQRSRLFWSLPREFTGNKVTSYGGNLTFSQRFNILPKGKPTTDIDVQIVGNGISLFWRRGSDLPPDELNVQTIPLVPGDWRRLDRQQGQKVASREDIMTVLSSIEAIIIRAAHNTDVTWTFLSDVSLDTAVPQVTGQKKATYIESCRCPVGYQGTSCESCSPGYYRDHENQCNKCPCNNNEESCSLGSGSRVVCHCKPSFTGTYCDSLAGLMLGMMPMRVMARPGAVVRFNCSYHSLEQLSITFEEAFCPPLNYSESLTAASSPFSSRIYRYYLGSERILDLKIQHGHKMITCKVRNRQGIVVGSLSSLINTETATPGPVTDSPSVLPQPTISISMGEPTYRIALIGETVRMNCYGRSLTPDRVVSLKWSKDGGELPRGRYDDNMQGLLTISNIRPSDSGVYICTASDGYSFVTEQARLYVEDTHRNVAPKVTVTPAYLTVREGDPVEFRCLATGTPTPVSQWIGQGGMNRQASFTGGLFYINAARREDEGTYECTATNVAGSDAKRVVLKVESTRIPIDNASSILSVEPKEFVGSVGETVELQCLSLMVDYTTHWNRSGQPLPSYAQDRDGVLTIYNAKPSDSGIYICYGVSLSNGHRVQTQTRVSVESRSAPPKVMIEPESQTILQGMSGEIRCLASGDPPPNVKWTKQQERDYFPPNVQVVGNILRITSARVEDRGLYVCLAENSAGSSRGAARVEVEPREPPQAVIYPQEYNTVIEGGSVMVQCRVTAGIPTPRLHWSRSDGRPIPYGSELPGGALRLMKVSMQDKGQYLCNVSNDVGSVTAVASVDVQQLPVIHMRPAGPLLTVRLGQSVRLECSASGHPPPSVTWSPPDKYGGLRGLASGPTYELRKEVAVYEINEVQARDEGIYTCKAQNAAGPAEEEIQLLISNELDVGPTRGDVPAPLSSSSSAQHPLTQGAEGKVELDETNFRLPTGAQAHIRCVARGNDNLYLKWVKDNGLPLPPEFYSRDGVLYLNNVQREDAGFYTCLGLSPTDNAVLFTATASLKVIELPRITLDPERQFKRPGESAQIRCIAHGDQPINISWAAVGRNLPPSVSNDRGYLTFSSIVPEDAGHYICRARNPYGDAEAVAEVIVNSRTNYTHPVVTAEDRNPRAFEGSDITLRCDSDPATNITWSRYPGQLPQTSRLIGNALYINFLRPEDSGRYVCDAISASGVRSSDHINLYVTPKKCDWRQFQCLSGQCVPDTAVCDGYPQCADRSDERNCSFRLGRGASDVNLRITPSKDVVSIGDDVELQCVATGSPKTEITWTQFGDTYSANVHDDHDTVRITGATLSNRGLYKCKAPKVTGYGEPEYVEAEYILNVLDPPNTPRPSSEEREAQKRSAAYGYMVVLDCDAQLLPPVVYSWMKEAGEIQPNTNTRQQRRLVIPYATSADAGLYVCSAQSGDIRINIPTILTVTRAVPFFSQAPVSYIAVPTLRDANLEFEIEISFKPEQYDGLILYNSQSRDGSGDFVSFGMKNGLLEFRFDVGSGLAIIRNDRPIQLSQWHTVQLHRVRKEGKMYVDGKGPFTGLGSGAFVQLDLLETLFLGGVPSFANVNKQAGLNSGFVGCISRLVIGKKEVDIIKETLTKEGVTDCETCAVNPCENNGVCQEAQTKQGYKCICPRGFRGENCSYIGDPCYQGACGSGKCVSSGSGLKCMCPLNKAGDRCERSISIVQPAFSGESYLAYPAPKANHKLKIALKINPSEVSDSLLLYSAQNEQGTGDFVSLSIKDRHVEFRFNSGQGPVILRSRHELKPGHWVTISAVRDQKEDGRTIHSRLAVDKEAHVSKSEPPHKAALSLRTFVFVGGINRQSGMRLAPDVGVQDGFHGCISEVEVSGLDLDLLRSVMESSNVQECSDMHGDLCNLNPCQNNAVCRPTSHPPRYICDCQSGFSGVHCEHENNMCQLLSPCHNGAKCTGTSSSYYCDCPLGYSGPTCSIREEFTTEVSFKGNGYIELDKRLLPHTNPNEKEVVTIEFSTDKPNSILFWHGQSPEEDGRDQDFLSLAVVNGHLEMSWELGDGPGLIRSPKRVDDGMKHTVQMMRTGQTGSFSVDNTMKVQADSPGTMTRLNTNGNIFIGGLPDIEKMTDRRYTEGLDGCIHLIQIQNSGVINLMDEAVNGVNVGRCTRNDFDDYSNDIAAPIHTHIHRGDVQIH
nr:heparan sulfate proteoglycan [Laodelphax striatellus]